MEFFDPGDSLIGSLTLTPIGIDVMAGGGLRQMEFAGWEIITGSISRMRVSDLGQGVVVMDDLTLELPASTLAPVPVPSTFLLMGSGLIGLVGWRWWSAKAA